MLLGYRSIVESFVKSAGGRMASFEEIGLNTTLPMAYGGMTTLSVMQQAQLHNLDYWYVDTGYFGNVKLKNYLRITKNSCQNISSLIQRSRDRLDMLKINIDPVKRGSKILIAPPDSKVCLHYGINNDESWIDEIIEKIKSFTDRKIIIRRRTKNRRIRLTNDTFNNALQQDINVVVTYTSNCAVEAVLHNIPVISVGPSAAVHVSPFTLEQIDNIPNIDLNLKEVWMRHLSYAQFNRDEMASGYAWHLLNS